MRLLAFVLLLSLAGATALATAVRIAPLDELARDADLVALVSSTPLSEESHWEGGRIVTSVELEVEEVWGGAALTRPTIRVVTLGGQVGEFAQRVDGAAVLPTGERLVTFLARGDDGRYYPQGMWQGVWLLVDDGPDPIVARAHPYGLPGGAALRMPERLSDLKLAVQEARHAP